MPTWLIVIAIVLVVGYLLIHRVSAQRRRDRDEMDDEVEDPKNPYDS